MVNSSSQRRNLVSPSWDFWLLGGFSFSVGVIFLVAEHFRYDSSTVKNYMLRIPATFGVLSLLCNYPHFLISYKIGYGRGAGFIGRNWFQLILVPLALITLFAFSFQLLNFSTPENFLTLYLNKLFLMLGTDFSFGAKVSLGHELLTIAVWIMYLTVGWHYSKQVFGCLATYSGYDEYPLSARQRGFLKWNLLLLAVFNFIFINTYAKQSGYNANSGSMSSILFEFPPQVAWAAALVLLSSLLAMLHQVVYKNYRKLGRWPSATSAIIFISFYIWWLPVFYQPEFYLWAVPFFHSLQYLPFAYRMENSGPAQIKYKIVRDALRLCLLLATGFAAFELFPEILDSFFDSSGKGLTSFFAAAAIVFLNVHHFFIDNVSWRFKDKEVRAALLAP